MSSIGKQLASLRSPLALLLHRSNFVSIVYGAKCQFNFDAQKLNHTPTLQPGSPFASTAANKRHPSLPSSPPAYLPARSIGSFLPLFVATQLCRCGAAQGIRPVAPCPSVKSRPTRDSSSTASQTILQKDGQPGRAETADID